MWWNFLILVLAVSANAQPSKGDDSNERMPWEDPYLPGTITPMRYTLHLVPAVGDSESSFHGVVYIDVNLHIPSDTFILHARQLSITKTEVHSGNGTQIAISSAFPYEQNDYWVIKTVEPLQGTATLSLFFDGNLTAGFLKISYFNVALGKRSWLWVTNFRPSGARSVFPNFDEPRFKAPFRITIRHWKNFTALSNMPEESQRDLGDVQETTFKLSPKMSSHVLGFAITDFDQKNVTVNGKMIRVWAQRDRLEQVNYALTVTPTIMNYLEQELSMSYSLEKLDQIAVPGDLFKNAATNWGLVIYKESQLLVDETQANEASNFQALKLIANAMAHNYFGNLVNCLYWEHAWLNEALSKFYEVRAVTAVDPTFYYTEYFYGMTLEGAMNDDADKRSSLLLPFFTSSIAVKSNFDNTRAEKGAAIMRMAENIVGSLKFKHGVQTYISKNAQGTVITSNLWDEVNCEPGLSIERAMSYYYKKTGIPVVKVDLTEGRMKATQKQLLNYPHSITDDTTMWSIYLDYRTKGGQTNYSWMHEDTVSFDNPLTSNDDDWVTFNNDRAGYYRVNYDAALWNRITRQLNENHLLIDQLTRSKLLGDALALVKAEELGYDVFLDLTRYASREEDFGPWSQIYYGFYDMTTMYNANVFQSFANYILNLTSNLMDKLQVKDEGTYIEKQVRSVMMPLACSASHKGCIANVTRMFREWIQDETVNTIPKTFLASVLCHAIAESTDETEWNTTLERYRLETLKDNKNSLHIALCCTRNADQLERLLDLLCLDPTEHVDDCHNAISYIAGHVFSDHHAWKWLKHKYADIDRVRGLGVVPNLLQPATEVFNTPALYQEILDFYAVYPDIPGTVRDTIKSRVDRNIRWMDKHLDVITTWLTANVEIKQLE